MDALVAYLQGLGTNVQPPAPEAAK